MCTNFQLYSFAVAQTVSVPKPEQDLLPPRGEPTSAVLVTGSILHDFFDSRNWKQSASITAQASEPAELSPARRDPTAQGAALHRHRVKPGTRRKPQPHPPTGQQTLDLGEPLGFGQTLGTLCFAVSCMLQCAPPFLSRNKALDDV